MPSPDPTKIGKYPYGPDSVVHDGVPQGTFEKFTHTSSVVYPGVMRRVWIYVPAQYDPKKPACVYVKTDGFNPREKTLLETAIATKEMPVTVGVFVRPGELPAPMKGALGRRNRDLEYDGVGDENVTVTPMPPMSSSSGLRPESAP